MPKTWNCIVAVQAFQQRHYWAEQLGPVLCIGLSTVRFRSNEFSVHEVRRCPAKP